MFTSRSPADILWQETFTSDFHLIDRTKAALAKLLHQLKAIPSGHSGEPVAMLRGPNLVTSNNSNILVHHRY
jgi:hypothetical protein